MTESCTNTMLNGCKRRPSVPTIGVDLLNLRISFREDRTGSSVYVGECRVWSGEICVLCSEQVAEANRQLPRLRCLQSMGDIRTQNRCIVDGWQAKAQAGAHRGHPGLPIDPGCPGAACISKESRTDDYLRVLPENGSCLNADQNASGAVEATRGIAPQAGVDTEQ